MGQQYSTFRLIPVVNVLVQEAAHTAPRPQFRHGRKRTHFVVGSPSPGTHKTQVRSGRLVPHRTITPRRSRARARAQVRRTHLAHVSRIALTGPDSACVVFCTAQYHRATHSPAASRAEAGEEKRTSSIAYGHSLLGVGAPSCCCMRGVWPERRNRRSFFRVCTPPSLCTRKWRFVCRARALLRAEAFVP